MTAPAIHDPWSHKGWAIDRIDPPGRLRGCDWEAVSPDFEADWGEDGYEITRGQRVQADTYEDLIFEIEQAIWEEATCA